MSERQKDDHVMYTKFVIKLLYCPFLPDDLSSMRERDREREREREREKARE